MPELVTNLIAGAALLLSVLNTIWNRRQDKARNARLSIELEGTQPATRSNAAGGFLPNPPAIGALQFCVTNEGQQAPLTVIGIGYSPSRRWFERRVRKPVRFFPAPPSVDRIVVHKSAPASTENRKTKLDAGDTIMITVYVKDLPVPVELGGIYAECARHTVAWLPRHDLRALRRLHAWASPSGVDPLGPSTT